MSIERCAIHDRVWDSDFFEGCPICSWPAVGDGLTRQRVAEAFERICCDRPQGCEGVPGVDGYCLLSRPLDKLFPPSFWRKRLPASHDSRDLKRTAPQETPQVERDRSRAEPPKASEGQD